MNIEVDSENDNENDDVENVEPQRHETLWLSDGNVVLSTTTHLFRVHKSMLAMRSSVFKDMFDLSTTEDVDVVGGDEDDGEVIGIAPELYEGLPMVALEDEGEDVEHLLKAIYEPRCVVLLSTILILMMNL